MGKRNTRIKHPATLSTFLRKSNVPGLSYLATSRNATVRLAWLLAILGCVGAALAIVYLNVTGWDDNPVVITTVTSALVEVGGASLNTPLYKHRFHSKATLAVDHLLVIRLKCSLHN